MKKVVKVLATLIGIVLVILIVVNIYVHVAFASFYGSATAQFETPGMSDGFVVQCLTYFDYADTYLFSGYKDNADSPLYRRHSDGTSDKIYLLFPNGAAYDGHGGGCSYYNGQFYLTCENGYLVFAADDILSAPQNSYVQAHTEETLDFTPAFLSICNNVMYTGEFYYAGTYETAGWEHITTPDGTQNPAIMYTYAQDDSRASGFSEWPFAAYSIPGKVQGCVVTPDNKIVLSTSYGLSPSQFFVYDLNRLTQDGEYQVSRFASDGGKTVPLFCLDSRSLAQTITAPPMSEGIILKDGQVWMTDESASNKYIFGKLYAFFPVYSFTI